MSKVPSLQALAIGPWSYDTKIDFMKVMMKEMKLSGLQLLSHEDNVASCDIIAMSDRNGRYITEYLGNTITMKKVTKFLLHHFKSVSTDLARKSVEIFSQVAKIMSGMDKEEELILIWVEPDRDKSWSSGESKKDFINAVFDRNPTIVYLTIGDPNDDTCEDISIKNILNNKKDYDKFVGWWYKFDGKWRDFGCDNEEITFE